MKTNGERILCPVCAKPTPMTVTPKTRVEGLTFWCRRCKQTFPVYISSEPEPRA